MRKKILMITTSIAALLIIGSCKKSNTEELEKRTVVIMTDGLILSEKDVTGMEEGKDVIYLGNGPYVWQGEDTISYKVEEGLIYVKDKLIGADLSQIDPGKVPNPEEITVLTGVLPNHLPGIKRFKYLAAVEAKGISDDDMAIFADFEYMKGLYLLMSNIAFDGLSYLKSMKHLRLLHIPRAPITDAALTHLKDLTNLRELNIGSTPISDEGIANLEGLENLRSLNIHYTYVTDKGLMYLEGLKNLRELNLMHTSIGDIAVKKLKRAVPNCRISHKD